MLDPALAAAAAQSEAALAAGHGDAYDHMIVALKHAALGDHAAAQRGFDHALSLEPDNASILVGLAKWQRQRGALRDAVLNCDAAIRLAPDYADAWLERGTVLAGGGSVEAAADSFANAARLSPTNATARASFASQLAILGKPAEAERAAREALAIEPSNILGAATLAGVLVERGEAAAARAILMPLIDHAQLGNDRAIAANWLGRANEKLGDYAEAFAWYARSKADFARLHEGSAAEAFSQTAFVEAIGDAIATMPAGAFAPIDGDTSPRAIAPHVFLIGYPRSGTTLVENVLASLPGVAASEEWPTFGAADRRYLLGDAVDIAEGVGQFAALDAAGRAALHDDYWSQVAASGVPRDAAGYIDMDPIKATRLPFIAALFPAAKILVMRRDPRDVVWSCFRTSFAMTSNTLEYTTLERAARHYDAMMRLTDRALEKLPVTAMDVDYRALVHDFDATTKAICAFVGLEWSPEVRRFDRTADRRGVGTASATQVRKTLYDGSGQWKPFARWLEPVMPILAPWIDRFGAD